MENKTLPAVGQTHWYSEDFVYQCVTTYLKQNGYKVSKEGSTDEKTITASRFFKKEIIEIKGYPYYFTNNPQNASLKSAGAKSWFSDALLNSFINFGNFDSVEVAMALPNVGRYQAIIKKLNDYFTHNDLYFRIYLVNEDGTVEVSNLNQTALGQRN